LAAATTAEPGSSLALASALSLLSRLPAAPSAALQAFARAGPGAAEPASSPEQGELNAAEAVGARVVAPVLELPPAVAAMVSEDGFAYMTAPARAATLAAAAPLLFTLRAIARALPQPLHRALPPPVLFTLCRAVAALSATAAEMLGDNDDIEVQAKINSDAFAACNVRTRARFDDELRLRMAALGEEEDANESDACSAWDAPLARYATILPHLNALLDALPLPPPPYDVTAAVDTVLLAADTDLALCARVLSSCLLYFPTEARAATALMPLLRARTHDELVQDANVAAALARLPPAACARAAAAIPALSQWLFDSVRSAETAASAPDVLVVGAPAGANAVAMDERSAAADAALDAALAAGASP